MKQQTGNKLMTRAERQAQTRAALLDAAAEVFVARGFLGSSVEAIAAAAGLTRGAFYSNFDSKEQLFAELLQDRVYETYRTVSKDAALPGAPSLRQVGEQLAAMQAAPEGRWLFRLWLELLAHAGRDEQFRQIAAGFWSGTRALTAHAIAGRRAKGGDAPAPDDDDRELASAMIALDVGLALQHFVDPEAVPLSVYPELYERLFGRPSRT